jgi:ABC-2 type transport system ATP-binding protein
LDQPALAIKGLTKIYGGSGNGVRNLQLTVPRGGLHGFLGRNGAGKTTTLKCIMGLLRTEGGRFELFGESYDPAKGFKLRRRIGYSPELPIFPAHLTGRKVLQQYGRMRGLGPAEIRQETTYLFETLELKGAAENKVPTYSKGMQAKLGIAMAMLGDPELLILDEPTSGLDPVAMAELRELLHGLVAGQNGGRTVLLSSHQLHEVQQLCSSVTIIDAGSTIVEGPVDQLVHTLTGGVDVYRAEFQSLDEPLIADIRSLPEVVLAEPIEGSANALRIRLNSEADLRENFARFAVAHRTFLLSCELETLSIEDLFLWFVKGRGKTPATQQPVVPARVSPPLGARSPTVRAIRQTPTKGATSIIEGTSVAPENPIASLPAAIGPSALTAESWVLNLQTEIANLENALKEQRNLLSRLDGEFQNGRIERNRFEEMGRSASDLIAEIEKNLAERRQRLPKDTTENLSGERNM